jgi:O-antigen ligase
MFGADRDAPGACAHQGANCDVSTLALSDQPAMHSFLDARHPCNPATCEMPIMNDTSDLSSFRHGSEIVVLIQRAFWILLFVAFPLMVNPFAFREGRSIEDILLLPKLMVLIVAWFLGLAAIGLRFRGISLADVPRLVRLAPIPIKILLVFLAVLAIAGGFADGDPAVVLLGGFGRLDGVLIQIIWYSLALVAFVLALGSAFALESVLRIMVIGALFSSVWISFQVFSIEPLMLLDQHAVATVVPSGPLGHVAVTTGYVAIMLIVYATFVSRTRHSLKPVPLVVIAALMAGVIAAGGRTGLFIILSVWPLVAVASYRDRRVLFRMAILTGAMALGTGAMLVAKPVPQREAHAGRIVQAAEGRDPSFNSRLRFWPAAIRGVTERPFLGAGPSAYSAVFWRYASTEDKVYVVRSHLPEGIEELQVGMSPLVSVRFSGNTEPEIRSLNIDKAHNYLLDLAVASGVVAVVVFALLVVSSAIMMLRSASPIAHAILAGTVAAAIFSMAWFATLVLDPMVWSMIGVGLGAAAQRGATNMVR